MHKNFRISGQIPDAVIPLYSQPSLYLKTAAVSIPRQLCRMRAVLALVLGESMARIEYGAYGTPGSTVLPPGRPWAPKEFQGLAEAEASRASDGRGL